MVDEGSPSSSNSAGKPSTLLYGVKKARGEYILFTDMDQSTPIKHIEDFFIKFEEGCDIVIGSRTGRKGAPLFRKIMAFGFVVLRAVILQLAFKDTQCGFKVYQGDIGRRLYSQSISDGFMFDVEIISRALKQGYRIKEFPVDWTCDKDSTLSLGRSFWQLWSELRMIKSMLKEK